MICAALVVVLSLFVPGFPWQFGVLLAFAVVEVAIEVASA